MKNLKNLKFGLLWIFRLKTNFPALFSIRSFLFL